MFRAFLGISITLSLLSNADHVAEKKAAVTEVKKTVLVVPKKKSLLEKISNRYSQAKTAKMQVTKRQTYAFFGEPQVSRGKMFFQENQFRLDTTGAKARNIILINQKDLQLITFPSEKSLKAQVIEGSFNSSQGVSSKMLSSLLSGKNLHTYFTVTSEEKKEGKVWLSLSPKEELEDFQNIKIKVSKDNLIEEFQYSDLSGNQTFFQMSQIEFNTKIDPKVFSEKIPADAIRERF